MTPVRRQAVVIIAPVLPEETPEHAGGRLLRDIVLFLTRHADVSVIVPDGPAVRRGTALPGLRNVIVVEAASSRQARTTRLERYVVTGEAPTWFQDALRKHGTARQLLRDADVIDLQWQEQGCLVPWLRSLTSRARITVFLHDVISQREKRALDTVTGRSPRDLAVRTRWRWARRRALAAEARLTGAERSNGLADAVGVLSDKDASLLPGAVTDVVVVRPALGGTYAHVRRTQEHRAHLLLVAYMARWANEEGLTWFVRDVLPLVRDRVPDVRLTVAGGGLRSTVRDLAAQNGVELLGFVADLDPLYASADVVVVPLLSGAGVKFKVVEALSAGVPVVTTPVGAEGIGKDSWFAGIFEDPQEFATAVVAVVDDPGTAAARAASAREAVARQFGREGFECALSRYYGLGGVTPAQEGPLPEVSVVIPAYNAALTIYRQLDALARQEDAPPFEVIVADNRSTDDTATVAGFWEDQFPRGLRVVDAYGAQGVSHARNMGIEESRAEKILICDADDRVDVGWVREMAAALDHHDLVGCPAVETCRGVRGTWHAPAHTIWNQRPHVLGGAMGVRRSVWSSVGGFDEAFPAGHEEVDFCWRVQEAGHSLGTTDATHVEYEQRETAREKLRQGYAYAQGAMLLWTRFEGRAGLPPVSFVGSVKEAVLGTARTLPRIVGSSDHGAAHGLGWLWGVVAGHLKYRKAGRPPRQRLWPRPGQSSHLH